MRRLALIIIAVLGLLAVAAIWLFSGVLSSLPGSVSVAAPAPAITAGAPSGTAAQVISDQGEMSGQWDVAVRGDVSLVIVGETDGRGDCSVRAWGPGEDAHIWGARYRAFYVRGDMAAVNNFAAALISRADMPCERR